MTRIVRRCGLLIAAALTTLALAACSGGTSGMGNSSGAPMSASDMGMQGRSGDGMFAQMMIPHHQQAVEMSDIALDKASTGPEVRALAKQVKAAQAPEIATMQGWLKAWGVPAMPSTGMVHGDGMMNESDMTQLKAAEGEAFDRMWLTMMVDHHQGAIVMADQVLATTTDPEVKKLAQAIVSAQKTEITTMQQLLAAPTSS